VTPQQIVRFDLNEIPALEVRCKCGTVISLPFTGRPLRERLSCAGCNEMLWGTEMENDKVFTLLQNLVRAFSMWKEVQPKQFSVGFSLVGKIIA
jgi:hypothetical protein